MIHIFRDMNAVDPEPWDNDVLDALVDEGLPRDGGLVMSLDYCGLDDWSGMLMWEVRVQDER